MRDIFAWTGALLAIWWGLIGISKVLDRFDPSGGWVRGDGSSQRQQDGKVQHRASASERAEDVSRSLARIHKLEQDLRWNSEVKARLTGRPGEA